MSAYHHVLVQRAGREGVFVEMIGAMDVAVFLPIGKNLVKMNAFPHRYCSNQSGRGPLRDACQWHGNTDAKYPGSINFFRFDVACILDFPPDAIRGCANHDRAFHRAHTLRQRHVDFQEAKDQRQHTDAVDRPFGPIRHAADDAHEQSAHGAYDGEKRHDDQCANQSLDHDEHRAEHEDHVRQKRGVEVIGPAAPLLGFG